MKTYWQLHFEEMGVICMVSGAGQYSINNRVRVIYAEIVVYSLMEEICTGTLVYVGKGISYNGKCFTIPLVSLG